MIRRGGKNSSYVKEGASKKKSNRIDTGINDDSIFSPSVNNNNSIKSSYRTENQKIKRRGFKILDYEDITFGRFHYNYYWRYIIITIIQIFIHSFYLF